MTLENLRAVPTVLSHRHERIYHVLFDRKPQVMGHLCLEHTVVPDMFRCETDHGDGECDHVQLRSCDCASEPPCVVCCQLPLPGLA